MHISRVMFAARIFSVLNKMWTHGLSSGATNNRAVYDEIDKGFQ